MKDLHRDGATQPEVRCPVNARGRTGSDPLAQRIAAVHQIAVSLVGGPRGPRHPSRRSRRRPRVVDGDGGIHLTSSEVTVARQVLSEYQPAPGLFPTGHIPTRRDAVLAEYADVIERTVEQL